MLKDYLSVARDALRTQKELYHVKEQRLALALDEYVRLNDAYKEKSSSHTSCKCSVAAHGDPTGLWGVSSGVLFPLSGEWGGHTADFSARPLDHIPDEVSSWGPTYPVCFCSPSACWPFIHF